MKCFILFIFSLLSWRLAPAMRICRARICDCGHSQLDPRTELSEAVGEVPPTALPPSLKVCFGGGRPPQTDPMGLVCTWIQQALGVFAEGAKLRASFTPGFSKPQVLFRQKKKYKNVDNVVM